MKSAEPTIVYRCLVMGSSRSEPIPPVAITLAEAAEAVRMSTKTLIRAIHATEPPFLRAKKHGHGYRIAPADTQEWFDSLPDAGT